MANESTSSTLSELYTEIVAEALFVASERSVMRPLVKNYAIQGGGKAVEVPIYAAVSAAAVSEASDLSNTAINPSSVTITASENGIMTTLTDLARNSAPRNVAADIGRLFGEAIAKKIDVDLTALFDGFSQEVGDGTAVLSAANVFNAVAVLRKTGVPTTEISGVFHPLNAYDLKSGLTNTFVGRDTELSNEALRNGFVGKVAGVNIFETSNMADSSGNNPGTTGDYKGAVFHRDALGMAMMQDLKIETQRDASLRADEIVATSVYGVGELHDTYGVEMNVDSSIQ
ncbi:HK97 family major capsid protein [uncultured Mediterranean phage uvDeep-CGR2-AD8-C175]|nr:HK97 family major capsid protein [uncultured Mediterranean phage uvDeep-CGR2-AD8-C175]